MSTSPHPATRSVAYAIDAGAKASSKGTSSRGADPSELVTPVTITLPPIALPAVTVQAAPPALITRRNAGHVGMSGSELLRVLREMRADSHFRDAVIVRGKSFRAASPDSIIAFLRASAASSGAANDEEGTDHGVDLSLLHAAGYELGPAPSKGQHVEGFARRAAPVQSDNMPRRRAASRPR